MRKISQFISFAIIILACSGASLAARSPLGIGVAEQTINPASPLAGIFLQIQAWQMQFEQMIQKILVGMRHDPEGVAWLLGLSFLYGILHAAGPGHGKAVISSYLVADNASLKRGVTLSFFSSILQALSAICIIGLIFWFLPGQLTQTTHFVVILSYALVMFVGVWLLIRHSLRLFRRRRPIFDKIFDNSYHCPDSPSMATVMGGLPESLVMRESVNIHSKPRLSWRGEGGASGTFFSGFREFCVECGQMHLIGAGHLQQKLRLKTALSLIFATGLRPCNGALFVMSFALLNRLEWVGVCAVFAMALGTFITVSSLACLAVYAKKLSLKLSANRTKPATGWLKAAIEWVASLFIFLTGLVLLTSSLS